jgi:alpha-tubulin suppressor-like RCC1 family protein
MPWADGTNVSRTTVWNSAMWLSDVVEIAAGFQHTCARLGDSTVRCWGANDNGQLGDGTTTNRSYPVVVAGLTNAVALSAGTKFTCALLATSTVVCWGANTDGQLGDGTTVNRATPAAVANLDSVTAVSAGHAHACAG